MGFGTAALRVDAEDFYRFGDMAGSASARWILMGRFDSERSVEREVWRVAHLNVERMDLLRSTADVFETFGQHFIAAGVA